MAISLEQRRDLLEILEDRYGNRSTVIASELDTKRYHDYLGEPTLADAVCDRVLQRPPPRATGAVPLQGGRLSQVTRPTSVASLRLIAMTEPGGRSCPGFGDRDGRNPQLPELGSGSAGVRRGGVGRILVALRIDNGQRVAARQSAARESQPPMI
jgi:hypothetical protein